MSASAPACKWLEDGLTLEQKPKACYRSTCIVLPSKHQGAHQTDVCLCRFASLRRRRQTQRGTRHQPSQHQRPPLRPQFPIPQPKSQARRRCAESERARLPCGAHSVALVSTCQHWSADRPVSACQPTWRYAPYSNPCSLLSYPPPAWACCYQSLTCRSALLASLLSD